MKIYTRKGDDGTTGLLYGGRVAKDAQAALGLARAEAERGSELDRLLVDLQRDLYVLMAELATAASNRTKLVAGKTLVTTAMVDRLEERIDWLTARFPPVTEFVLPGHDRASAALDVARTVVRRAERLTLTVALGPETQVVAYLNRLSDLLWTMARWQEGQFMPARERKQ